MQSMLKAGGPGSAKVDILSDREITITRVFNAPRRLVFEAITKPEYVRRWYGPRVLDMKICEIDLRVGGTWRYVLSAPDGSEHGFTGEYREIDVPARIVSTENYEAMMPGHEMLVTTTLDEVDGRTTLRSHIVYQSKGDRDGHLQSGMEGGMQESFDRCAELLATMA